MLLHLVLIGLFLHDLGHSPMAEAKRMRHQPLRSLLLDHERDPFSAAELMKASGLIASSVTSVDCRLRFGESSRQARQRHLASLTP